MIDLDAIKARLTAAIPGPWSVELIAHAPADIGALIAEVERLRSINDEYLLEMGRQHAKLREQALEAKRERAAVVAWLRDKAPILAFAIERGEHRREET